jgi:hypothetical protein
MSTTIGTHQKPHVQSNEPPRYIKPTNGVAPVVTVQGNGGGGQIVNPGATGRPAGAVQVSRKAGE